MRTSLRSAVGVSVVLSALAASPPAMADTTDVDPTGDLATALDLPSGVTVSKAGTSTEMFGVSSRAFDDLPRRGGAGSYAVMSTGRATDLFNVGLAGMQPSTNFGGTQDSASLTFDVAPGTAGQCLLVDVAMGTEERVHTFTASSPSDGASLRLNGVTTEYAKQVGPRFFRQDRVPMAPVNYTVNAIDYWHGIDQEFERQPDDSSAPLLPAVTPFDNFTSVDTLEVPLDANDPSLADSVSLSVSDVNNNSLDTVLLVDRVRLAPTCSTSLAAETGLYPTREFVILGHRGVNNILSIDLIPETDAIERYDASDNGWYPSDVDLRFRWYRGGCGASGDMDDWTPIPDADRQTYSPTIKDKGKCILALVTGLKDGYRTDTYPSPGSSAWKSTLAIQEGVFTNEDIPTITKSGDTNTVKAGEVLTATNGTFVPRPDSFTFQWYADGSPVSGETGQTFKVTAAQAGKKIKVRVAAARLNFDSMAIYSQETNPVDLVELSATPEPVISGSGRANETLSAVTGTWLPDPVTLSYQWYADGTAISGATKAAYVPTATQVGKNVSVYVTGKKSGYLSVTKQSAPVVVTLQGFVDAPAPTISGTGLAGDILTAVPGTWNPVVTPSYQWYADNVAISGANKSTYRPTEAQVGQQLHVVATAGGSGTVYELTSRQSAPLTVTFHEYAAAPDPGLTGEAFVGSKLVADTSGWNPAPSKFTYEWFADGVKLSNTASSLTLTDAQRGKHVTVAVTPVRDYYEKATRTSAPVGVQIRSFIAVAPTISGSQKVGQKLTANVGTWLPTPAIGYRWLLDGVEIGNRSYVTVPAGAAGKSIVLEITGSKTYYETTVTKTQTGRIAYGTLTSATPSISGSTTPGGTLRSSVGRWSPGPITYRYQWYVGSKAIKGATKSSYKVSSKYRNKKIRVRVTGIKSGYTTVYRYSSYKKIAKR